MFKLYNISDCIRVCCKNALIIAVFAKWYDMAKENVFSLQLFIVLLNLSPYGFNSTSCSNKHKMNWKLKENIPALHLIREREKCLKTVSLICATYSINLLESIAAVSFKPRRSVLLGYRQALRIALTPKSSHADPLCVTVHGSCSP